MALKKTETLFIDRVFLMGKRILDKFELCDGVDMFVCIGGRAKSRKLVVLKYRYPGNTQYHAIKLQDIDRYEEAFALAKNILAKK